jgi:hypothetical protein
MIETLVTISWDEGNYLLIPAACVGLVLGRLHGVGFVFAAPFILLVALVGIAELAHRRLSVAVPAFFAIVCGAALWLW